MDTLTGGLTLVNQSCDGILCSDISIHDVTPRIGSAAEAGRDDKKPCTGRRSIVADLDCRELW